MKWYELFMNRSREKRIPIPAAWAGGDDLWRRLTPETVGWKPEAFHQIAAEYIPFAFPSGRTCFVVFAMQSVGDDWQKQMVERLRLPPYDVTMLRKTREDS